MISTSIQRPQLSDNNVLRELSRQLAKTGNNRRECTPSAARAGARQHIVELVRRSLIQTDHTGVNTVNTLAISGPPSPFGLPSSSGLPSNNSTYPNPTSYQGSTWSCLTLATQHFVCFLFLLFLFVFLCFFVCFVFCFVFCCFCHLP